MASPFVSSPSRLAINRVAQRLADLEANFVVLEGFLAVGRNEHPDAGVDVLLELLRELRVVLEARQVRSRNVCPVKLLVAFAPLVRQHRVLGRNDRVIDLLEVQRSRRSSSQGSVRSRP